MVSLDLHGDAHLSDAAMAEGGCQTGPAGLASRHHLVNPGQPQEEGLVEEVRGGH